MLALAGPFNGDEDNTAWEILSGHTSVPELEPCNLQRKCY